MNKETKKIGFLFKEIRLSHNNFRHLRNIFKIDNLNIEYLFLDSNKKDILNSEYIRNNNIDLEKIKILNNNIEKNLLILNKFDIIIMCIFPTLKRYIGNIDDRINKNIIKIYLHHGLSPIYSIDELKKKKDGENYIKLFKERSLQWNKYNYYVLTCCNHLSNLLIYCGLSKNNLLKTSSLPQFNLNKIYTNIKTNFDFNNTILIILGEKRQEIKDNYLESLIKIIRDIYPEKKILIKSKFGSSSSYNFILKKFKNINFISFQKYLGNYLNCYINIITSGSTSYTESLIHNNKTIFFNNIGNDEKYMFFDFPIFLKKTKLLLCDNYIDFKHNLLKTNDKKYFDEEYEIDKKKFINFCIGRNELENFNIEFLNLIKNKF